MTLAHDTAQATSRPRDAQHDDLRARFDRMHAATRAGDAPSYDERMRSLDRLERMLLDRRDAFARAVAEDFGHRSADETLLAETFVTVQGIRHTKKHLRAWMRNETRPTSWLFLPGRSEIRWQPLGVVGIVSPWNYPVQLAFAPLAGVLAAGNRALLKPSELTPATSALIADAVRETFDPELVHVILGGAETGEAFTHLPFDHLVFTGSTRLGKIVMKAAAENLVPVTLELGGKSPVIVLDDAPLGEVAMSIATGKLLNAGQTCIAPDYVLVPEGKVEALVAELQRAAAKMYPTLRDNPDYTSIVNDRHRGRLLGYLDEARRAGVRAIELNPANESFDGTRKLAPTVLVEPADDLAVMQDEIFGPILPLRSYRGLDEAIRFVNDRPRPLALYVFGRARAAIERVLDRTVSGGVTVNDTLLHIAQDDLPFGGVGPAGMGAYHGREGFEMFSKKKPVFHQARLNGTGILRPPYGSKVQRLVGMLLGRG